MLYAYGEIYTGEFNNGEKFGKGILIFGKNSENSYDGEWFNDKAHGIGLIKYTNGD